jgi:hypothetical protein
MLLGHELPIGGPAQRGYVQVIECAQKTVTSMGFAFNDGQHFNQMMRPV